MSNFNVKYLLPGDNKDIILDKINYNFFQVFSNAVGEKGPGGNIGPTGLRGQAGRDGVKGATGDRAANWYFSSSAPSDSISQEDDVWVDVGSTGGQNVYFYTSGSWVYSGETLLSAGVFSTLIGASGPGGSTDVNVININGTPSNQSLVLSDATGTTGTLNPNLAKLHISTDASVTNEFPTLSLSKTFLPQSPGNIISFKWKDVGTSYNKEIILPGNNTFQSGLSSTYSSTGGSMNLSAPSNNINVASQSYMNFTGATGTSGAFSLSTPNVLNFTGSNLSANSSLMSVILGVGGTSYIQASATPSVPLVYLQGAGGGSTITASVSTSDDLLNVVNPSGNSLIAANRLDKFTWGSTGATGLKETTRISTTAPSTFPTFVRGAYLNNYLESGSPTNDICVITPTYSGSCSSDGKTNRVYLSVGSNYSWAGGILGSNQSRSIDFFLNSSTYSFGGIRAVKDDNSGVNTVQINDGGTAGTSGCQHIRLTFFGSSAISRFHYQAFSNNNYSCGWVIYTAAVLDPGAGGSKTFL